MNKEQKDLLFFGCGLTLISLIFGVGGALKHGLMGSSITLFICSAIFLVVTACHWPSLKTGYGLWMRAAHFIGSIVTAVILSLVFLLLFAPLGVLFRLIGKDFLNRTIDRNAKTYWHQRVKAAFQKESCEQQF